MKLNQLADQIHAKTIALIAIAKALEFSDLPNPHGGTPLSQSQAQQITAVFRYMRDRQIVEPKAAIAQMQMSDPAATEEIAISLAHQSPMNSVAAIPMALCQIASCGY